MLSPPIPLDQIQPNLVCELLTCIGPATAEKFGPTPWGPGFFQKVKYHLISITKSISKLFIPNFMCVLTNKRYKTYQTGVFILSPESCPRGGTSGQWGCQGGQKKNQIWSCGISNRRG